MKKYPNQRKNMPNPWCGTALPLSCTMVQPTAAVFLAGESPAPAIDQSAGSILERRGGNEATASLSVRRPQAPADGAER